MEKSNESKVQNKNFWKYSNTRYDIWGSNLGNNQQTDQKLQTTQNAMLRYILGISTKDKINLQKIFLKTKAKNVWGVANLQKLKYAGHVIRDSGGKCEPHNDKVDTLYWQEKQR